MTNSFSDVYVFSQFAGSNPIMRQLYEFDIDDNDTELDTPAHSCPRLWCYRSQVTIDHLQNALDDFVNKKRRKVCIILHEFLQKVTKKDFNVLI